MNCKHFKIWDSDPCCLEPYEGWKIVLPTMTCEKHDLETFKPVLKLHTEMWDECKKEFFSMYTIDQNLVDDYMKVYPEDKELINKDSKS